MKARGYTLIELLVVLAVLGVLASMAWPLAEVTVQREKERELRRALWEVRDAIDAYKAAVDQGRIARTGAASGYPPDLNALVQGAPDLNSGGQTMYFLRRVPRDPFADASLAAEKTWVLRSYQSRPEDPKPGVDVYDIASASTKVGLNGVPLAQW